MSRKMSGHESKEEGGWGASWVELLLRGLDAIRQEVAETRRQRLLLVKMAVLLGMVLGAMGVTIVIVAVMYMAGLGRMPLLRTGAGQEGPTRFLEMPEVKRELRSVNLTPYLNLENGGAREEKAAESRPTQVENEKAPPTTPEIESTRREAITEEDVNAGRVREKLRSHLGEP